MSEITVKTENCKGCQYCVEVCPKKAISISERSNIAGYQFAQVDRAKCIRCGNCYTICPDCVYEIV